MALLGFAVAGFTIWNERHKGRTVVIQGVAFDIGGVLAYDVWEHLLPAIALHHDLKLKDAEIVTIGRKLWREYECGPQARENEWQGFEQEYWEKFIDELPESAKSSVTVEACIQMTDAFIKPVEGMFPLLESLKESGVGLAICSNNNEFWFRHQWDKLNLGRFFDPEKVVLSCRVGFPKSSHGFEMFQEVEEKLEVSRAHCVFIDDRESNINISQQFGMVGIHFTGVDNLCVRLNDMGLLS